MSGVKKTAFDLPLSTRKNLEELAHLGRTTMTAIVISLIEEEAKRKGVDTK